MSSTKNIRNINEKGFKIFFFIELARFIACALITNSHFDGVYPINISWGGCPGNCLFFMISGFLMNNTKQQPFLGWYIKKILRLYIPLVMVNIIMIAVGYREPYLQLFIFPIKQFWFIPVMVVLYCCFYISCKHDNMRRTLLIIDVIAYIIVYCFAFDHKSFFVERHFYFLIMYGFIAMQIGNYLHDNILKIQNLEKKKITLYFVVSMLCVIGFLGMKLWIDTNSAIALNLQVLTQLFSFGFAGCLLLVLANFDTFIENFINKTIVGRMVHIISISTFEVYLIQYVIIYNLKDVLFPVNIILIIISITFCGYILHIISNSIYKCAIEA